MSPPDQETPETQPRVAIVGGGIGGLTLANALQKHGWGRVTVFEHWESIKSRGGAINIGGGVDHVLEGIGLLDKVHATGRSLSSVEAVYNGRVLHKAQTGGGTKRIMREALQRILFENLRPGTVRLGTPIKSFEEQEGKVVLDLGDSSEEFDLVVAADGINSPIGAVLFPDKGKQSAGTVVYSCLAPGDFMPVDVYEHHVNCGDWGYCLRSFAGSGLDGRWDGLIFICRSDEAVSSSWDSKGTKDDIELLLKAMDEYGGGCPEWIRSIVDSADRVFRWGIYEHSPKPSWISSGGKIVLLGDAAHAMAPFLGTGAQSAMQDAHLLAEELARNQGIHEALQQYEAQRKRPCEAIVSRAKAEGLRVTSFGPPSAFANMRESELMRSL